ncbi:PAS domain S-box protein [Halorussus caseinilyticus]|uniref:PAS domain S-box protein n=1 Tax=Halorussus caseinilyticus TaxID=3034025 RepID=A0ABD5WPB7_9EURY|nr:PAS domain S-box protein [Halorussus sp. DT72]
MDAADALADTIAVFDGSDAPATPYTTNEVADALDCSRRTAYNRLERLVERDDLETKKVGARGRVWWRPPADSDAASDLRESKRRFRSLVEAVDEYAIFRLDPKGRVVSWNEGAERIKGYDREEILGEHVSTFYTDEDAAAGVPDRNLADAADRGTIEQEGWRVGADGSRFWARVTLSAIRDDGELVGYAKVVRDMTEDRYAETERRLLYSTTHAIAAADTFEDGLCATLREVCAATDWEFGETWIPDDGGVLERASADYAEDGTLEPFGTVSESFTFERGEGLPGRVWESGDSEWIRDAATAGEETFVRTDEADRHDIGSALAVPITTEGGVVAVLVLAMTDSRPPDERMVELLTSVGVELGELVEHQRATAALAREKELTERILAASQTGIAVFDADGSVVRSNRRMSDIVGVSHAEMERYTAGEREMTNESGETVRLEKKPVREVLETGESVTEREVRIELPNAENRWVSVTAVPLEDEDGELERVVATANDVTRLKRQTQRLERQREDLRRELDDVFERIDDAFFALDENLQFTYVNERAESLLDVETADVLGGHVWNELEPSSAAQAAFEEALATQESTVFEGYYEPLETWFETHVYPSESGLSVYFQDVTERKERERELEQYERIVETVDDGVYVLDNDSRFVTANSAYEELTGYSADELRGRSASILATDDATLHRAERIHEGLVTGDEETGRIETEIERKDGQRIPVETHFAPYDLGDDVGRVGVLRDVTERRHRERELEEYERIIETVDDGVYVVNDDGEFVLVNDAYAEMLGYDREELLGCHVSLVADEETLELASEIDREIETSDDRVTAEADLLTKDGRRLPTEATFSNLPSDDGVHRVGVVRDVTDRRKFEETLKALHDSARQLLGAGSAAEVGDIVVGTATDVLDLPGVVVYRHDADDGLLVPAERSVVADFMRREFPEVPADATSITGSIFADGDPAHYDDICEVANLSVDPEHTEMRAGSFAPMGDHGILVVGSREAGEFDHRTRQLVELLAANAEAAYDRVAREEQLAGHREQLTALNNLNAVVRDINEALVQQSTRGEVEQVVCDRLSESDSYEFAWFGEVDPRSERVELTTEAGVEGYLDAIEIPVAPDDDRSKEPTGRAVLTEEVQISQNVTEEWELEDWRDHARTHGFRSAAAIPVVHEDTLYGVLNVYTERPNGFEGEERRVVGHLGEIVGHAIASIERKRALMSDEVVELEFYIRDVFEAVGVPENGGTISFHRTVPVGDGRFVEYGTATGNGIAMLETLTERLPYWEDVTVIREEFGTATFEARLSEPPVVSLVASNGGYIDAATIEDGDYNMTLHFPPTVEIRNVVERIRETYPTVEAVTRRQVSRSGDSLRRLDEVLADEMTDRQRTALEAAYFAGFFEWPRASSAQEVADSLDVADATFHQHVRLAEQKLLRALFEESTAGIR